MVAGGAAANAAQKRKLGIFYTPDEIADQMARWAITSPRAKVLDPSFGGCAFLRAAVEQLHNLRATRPARQVFGADRDPAARRWLESILRQGAHERQFYFGDFLSVQPSHFQTLFTVVLGNPPYVRHHALSSRLQNAAIKALTTNGRSLSAKASYWAYFVLHAINFVAPGGRLALVLPGALIHAEYAHGVRAALRTTFGKVTAILLQERIFADAEEESVLVFAEHRSDSGCEVRIGLASCSSMRLDADGLEESTRPLSQNEQEGSWVRALLDSRIISVYDRASARCPRLAEKATIRIGVVTGANRFFVLRPSAFRSLRLPRAYEKLILSRGTFVRGLVFDREALTQLRERNAPCRLLQPPARGAVGPAAREYLRKGIDEGIPLRFKCAIREPWYRVEAGKIPDAFLTYMAGTAPRLVLNAVRVRCTNAIHALTWKASVSEATARAVVLAFLSTLTQFSAEVEGRSYGGGVLKLEPSEAGRLVIPVIPATQVRRLFAEAHHLCLRGRYDLATQLVDDVLLEELLSGTELSRLKLGLNILRKRRLGRNEARRTLQS